MPRGEGDCRKLRALRLVDCASATSSSSPKSYLTRRSSKRTAKLLLDSGLQSAVALYVVAFYNFCFALHSRYASGHNESHLDSCRGGFGNLELLSPNLPPSFFARIGPMPTKHLASTGLDVALSRQQRRRIGMRRQRVVHDV